jgi:hypothetical protein
MIPETEKYRIEAYHLYWKRLTQKSPCTPVEVGGNGRQWSPGNHKRGGSKYRKLKGLIKKRYDTGSVNTTNPTRSTTNRMKSTIENIIENSSELSSIFCSTLYRKQN